MKGKIATRVLFITALCAFCLVMVLPTIGSKTLRVSFKDSATEQEKESIKKRFTSGYEYSAKGKDMLISGYRITDAVMNEIRSHAFVNDAVFEKHWAEKYFMAKKINLGLDLQGGMSLVLSADFSRLERKGQKFTDAEKRDRTEQAMERISNRVNTFGVSEPSIRVKGNDAIEIQLPGVRDPQAVKNVIGTVGRVEYRIVNDEYSALASKNLKDKNVTIGGLAEEQRALLDQIAAEIKLPDNLELLFYYDRNEVTKAIYPVSPMALSKEIALAGDDIAKAFQDQDNMGRLAVGFHLTADGAAKFSKVTDKPNWGKKLAIVIDDKVRSFPSINTQIADGRAIIQGNFTIEEVKVLSRIINEGSLPVDLKIVEERTVGPSLGQDSIESGVRALLAAALVVTLFMILYYKLAGIIADICLGFNLLIMMGLLSMMGFTITLPGIAGLILTIGMAVDANVIIYERIKEELKTGKTVRAAVTGGFDRAFWTIFDGNVTTLLAAFILAQMETGPIKGFAVTLSVGIISSMIAALIISKMIFNVILDAKKEMKSLSI